MAAFKEARSTAYESMILEGYTVDYCETNQELVAAAKAELATETGGLLSASLPTLNKFRMSGTAKTPRRAEIGGLSGASSVYRLPRYFFNVVKEGDALIFAVPDEAELHGWVQVIHRATGQSHKPVPPVRVSSSKCHFRKDERVRAHHLGLNQLASVKPHEVDHLPLIRELVSRMLDFRLKDPFVSLGWLSPAQNLIFDEYCNRYGIRTCQRHLVFLHELIRYGEEDITIDMELLHQSYVICADHVHGKAQGNAGINTVLSAEMEDFQAIRARLLAFLEKRLTGFRYYFPFNRPEAALENLLILMERVIDQSSDETTGSEAVHSVVRICLRNAAVLNYEQISDFARREAKKDQDPEDISLPTPEERLVDLIRLSEICIDALQQNEEYYSKAFIWFGQLFVEHTENFLSLLQMDMVEVLDNLPPDTWGIFQLFQLLNGFLVNSDSLANGQFHTALLNRFEPTVENYLNLMETSITQALVAGIEKEKWAPYSGSTSITDHGDVAPCPSVNSQPHVDTDAVSHGSLNVSKVPPASVSSSPGHLPSAVDDGDLFARQRTFNVIGPTSAFLDVLSRSRPLAFVGRAMRPTAIATSVANSGLSVAGSPQPSINIEGETELPSDLVCSLQCSRCCRTISTLICRLHALNEFIRDLAWPDRTKATSWAERTRTVCSQLLRESAKRTLIELESTLRNASRSTDFILPSECFTMINSITAIRMQLFSLCNRHEAEVSPDSKQNDSAGNQSPTELSMSQPTSVRMYTETEAFLEGVHRQMSVILTDHLLSVLSTVLNRLTRYDEGTILSSILTLAKSDNEDGKNYIHFIELNLQILCHNLVDDVYLLSIFERWYVGQLRQVDDWLAQRQESVLTAYQIKYLSAIVRVFLDFELQGVATHILDNVAYKNVCHRLQVEETTLSVSSSLSSRQASRAPSQSSTPDTRRKWMKVIEGGINSIAQGTGLRPRQS
ncbi:secretion activator [Sparganum proliferum]